MPRNRFNPVTIALVASLLSLVTTQAQVTQSISGSFERFTDEQVLGLTGSCCIDGACVADLNQDQCETDSCGSWNGADSACGGQQCPAAIGVCCLGAVCSNGLGFDACQCAGGQFMSGSNSCAGVQCAPPTGRCCVDSSCMPNMTQFDCDQICGSWGGAGSNCNIQGGLLPCGATLFGYCCLPDQSCNNGIGPNACSCQGGSFNSGSLCAGAADCNTNGIVDECEQGFIDCDSNGVPDECQADCNTNGLPDVCDLAAGSAPDCNTNGIIDECETENDCNTNGIPDDCELGVSCVSDEMFDCNFDGVINECDPDCNSNGTSDICELTSILNGVVDCVGTAGLVGVYVQGQVIHNNNCAVCHGVGGFGQGGAPNHRNRSRYEYQRKTTLCQKAIGHAGGGFGFPIEDYADLERYLTDLAGPADAHGGDGVPDECQSIVDCDSDDIADVCELASGQADDCNFNGIPDNCDITDSFSEDCDSNGIPDECELFIDCNTNGDRDECDVLAGTSNDCNSNQIPDECESDCNTNGIPDDCEGLADCNTDGVPDVCDPDCDTDGISDVCEIFAGATDCDSNGVLDECQPDCNSNGAADACDIAASTSEDVNSSGIPDECEADCNSNGLPDDLDLVPYFSGAQAKDASIDYGTNGLFIDDCNGQDDTPLEDSLVVDFGAECATIEHLSVAMFISHDYVGDLVIELDSPAGTTVTLMSRMGYEEVAPYCSGGECCGGDNQDMDVVFDDNGSGCAETAATVNGTQVSGTLHPHAGATGHADELATFTGEPECGTWTLRVHDAAQFDAGTLDRWSLHFREQPVSQDCNKTQIPDECEVASGTSQDADSNGIPDECFLTPDCNSNGIGDPSEVASGSAFDCDSNGVLDECELAGHARFLVTGLFSNNIVEHDAHLVSVVQELVSRPTGCEAPLSLPTGITLGPTGDIFVADLSASLIRRYDGANGDYLGDFASGGGLVSPIDLAFSPHTGNLLVLPLNQTDILEFDGETGDFIGVFGSVLGQKADMAFGPNGNLYVGNIGAPIVEQLDGITGAPLGNIITGGPLLVATSFAFALSGELYILDGNSGFIRVYDPTAGTFLFDLAQVGGGVAFFGMLRFGPDEDLYLAHNGFNTVGRIDPVTGTVISFTPPNPFTGGSWDIVFRPIPNDCNANQIPDVCEDCNANGLGDDCDIAVGTSQDADSNGQPDECQGQDATLALVVRDSLTGSDTANMLARSLQNIENGDTFFVELWATDTGAVNTGFAHVYATLDFPSALATAVYVEHRPPFTSQAGATIDQGAGAVTDLGGADATSLGLGVEPQWVRIAVVEFVADGCMQMADFALLAGSNGVAGVGRGLLDPDDIVYGEQSTKMNVDCVYNLSTNNSQIDAADLGVFAGCWLTGTGDPGFDPACDFDCSGFVDAGDLGWFAQGWLKQCSELTIAELPLCRQCQSAMQSPTQAAGDIAIGPRPINGQTVISANAQAIELPRIEVAWSISPSSAVNAGDVLTVSVAARDNSLRPRGVSGVFVHVDFDPSQVDVLEVTHASEFSVLSSARVDSANGRVEWMGGATILPGVGVDDRSTIVTLTLRARVDLLTGPNLSIAIPEGGIGAIGRSVSANAIRVTRIQDELPGGAP